MSDYEFSMTTETWMVWAVDYEGSTTHLVGTIHRGYGSTYDTTDGQGNVLNSYKSVSAAKRALIRRFLKES